MILLYSKFDLIMELKMESLVGVFNNQIEDVFLNLKTIVDADSLSPEEAYFQTQLLVSFYSSAHLPLNIKLLPSTSPAEEGEVLMFGFSFDDIDHDVASVMTEIDGSAVAIDVRGTVSSAIDTWKGRIKERIAEIFAAAINDGVKMAALSDLLSSSSITIALVRDHRLGGDGYVDFGEVFDDPTSV